MFYTMTLCGRYWKQIEATVETTRTWWNIVQNSMERYGMPWKLLVSYRTWARLTPTLTHVVTCNPMTSGAEDGQCHDNSPPPHHLHLPLTTHPHQHLGSPSKLARILNNSHTTDPQGIRVQWCPDFPQYLTNPIAPKLLALCTTGTWHNSREK